MNVKIFTDGFPEGCEKQCNEFICNRDYEITSTSFSCYQEKYVQSGEAPVNMYALVIVYK